MESLILRAVPGFFLLIAAELLWARAKRRDVYVFPDTMSNLACGVGSQIIGVLAAALTAVIYEAVRHRFAFVDLSSRPLLSWGAALVGVDFLYYWWHRASHRINLFWATHSVHHQSEEYNLSVALRQSWFAGFTGWPFYLPLALAGVPYTLFAASGALSLLYQYWIHTRLVGRLGPFEWIFNTPSHHRVHHGTNRRYLDKNYAATLIVWDRLFGTFTEEKEPVTYGVVEPLRRWSPFVANLQPWGKLIDQFRALGPGKDRWLLWWREPGWEPGKRVEPAETAGRVPWSNGKLSVASRVFALTALVTATAGGIVFLLHPAFLAGVALIGVLFFLGRILETTA